MDWYGYAHGQYLEEQEEIRRLEEHVQEIRGSLLNALTRCERHIENVFLTYMRLPQDRVVFFHSVLLNRMPLTAKIDGLRAVLNAVTAPDEFQALPASLHEARSLRNRLAHDVVIVEAEVNPDEIILESFKNGAPVTEVMRIEEATRRVESCREAETRLSRFHVWLSQGPSKLAELDALQAGLERAANVVSSQDDIPF